MDSIFLLLRRLRAPLIVLIASHAIAVLGLTLIQGADVNGNPAPPLDFFHAFYFITYTATTIGYTEPVGGFSDAQRLWVTACIYMLVTSWSYVIVVLLASFQDKGFQAALVAGRFKRRLRRLDEAFYLVCGYGETGSLVCRALEQLGVRFVILERDESRLQELELEDYRTDVLALAGEARQPEKLLQAGLQHRRCRGVLALTHDESTNLAVAMAVRLLNPSIPVLARARTAAVAANMASLGTDHVINPYEQFAEYLGLAAAAPARYRLIEWLTGLPGTGMPQPQRPPQGRWIVCGYGVFGRAILRHLRGSGNEVTVVDPQDLQGECDHFVRGTGTEAATLDAAGIRDAQGIVAGSDDDVANLAIAVTARELQPTLFIVTRQNLTGNSALFDAFTDDFCMVASRLVAQECLAILTTPLLSRFLDRLRDCDEAACLDLACRLQAACEDRVPEVWSVHLNAKGAAALHHRLILGRELCLGDTLRDNRDRSRPLPLVPLLLEREGAQHMLPAADFRLEAGDRLLFAGPVSTRGDLELSLQNDNALEYVLTGRETGGGWLWGRLFGRARVA